MERTNTVHRLLCSGQCKHQPGEGQSEGEGGCIILQRLSGKAIYVYGMHQHWAQIETPE